MKSVRFKYLSTLIILALIVGKGSICLGQSIPITTIEEKSISKFIYDIAQSKDGQLFIATDQGLANFNGKSFKHYNINNGFLKDFITKVSILDNDLFITYFESGISVTKVDEVEANMTFHLTEQRIIGTITVANKIYALGFNGSVYQYDSSKKQFEFLIRTSDAKGFCALDGHILAYNYNSIQLIDPIDRIVLDSFYNDNGVKCFSQNIQGNTAFYADDNGGINLLNIENKRLKSIPTNKQTFSDVTFLLETNNGKSLFSSSMSEGLEVFSIHESKRSQLTQIEKIGEGNGLNGTSVKTLFMDLQGNFWIGGFGIGLSYIPTESERFTELKTNISSAFLQNDLVHATDGIYYFKIDPKSLAIRSKNNLSFSGGEWGKIKAIDQTRGIAVVNGKKVILYNLSDLSVIEELSFSDWDPIQINNLDIRKDKVILSTDAGLCVYSFKDKSSHVLNIQSGLPSNRVLNTSVYSKEPTKTIIGLDGGSLSLLDEDFTLEEIEIDLLNYRINKIVSDAYFNCFSAVGEGLFCVVDDKYKKIEVNEIDQVVPSFLMNIESLNDSLLAAISSGSILVLKQLKGNKMLIQKQKEDKKINSSDFVYYNNSLIYFSGGRVQSFRATQSANSIQEYFPISIGSVNINGENFSSKKQLKLDPGNYKVRFDFISPQYSPNAHRVYEYNLKGYEDFWYQTTDDQNYAYYPNLGPGKYTFQVRLLNQRSIFSTIDLVIQVPIWKRPWFIVLVILLSLTIIFITVYVRERYHSNLREYLTYQIDKQTEKIRRQSEEIETKSEEILDSIKYSKRIQDAILPPVESIKEAFADAFVFYQPKDIVAGDFYFFSQFKEHNIIAAADCTGHGVPGAFMSVLCSGALELTVNKEEIINAASILDGTQYKVVDRLEKSGKEVLDGMDIALCSINSKTRAVEYAGAHNSLIIVSKHNRISGTDLEPIMSTNEHFLFEIKADKQPIGKYPNQKPFTNNELQLNSGDSIYLFTDGYIDQFGGSKGKKLKFGPFKESLLKSAHLSKTEQCKVLKDTLDDWMGNHEQIDDVLVIGVQL